MMMRSNCLSSSSRQVEAADAGGAFVFQQVAAKRVAEALGLLADLLQHEVGVAAPLHRGEVPVDLVDRLADSGGLQVAHPVAVAGEHHHLAVVEVDHRAGVLQQRRRVRGHEALVLADAHQQRRALPGRHQHAGLVGRDEGQTVGAVHVPQRAGDGLLEVALVELAHQVGQHLGVGLRLEGVAALLQRLSDGARVLDDAVMDDGDPPGLVGVRMGVGAWWARRGWPSGCARCRSCRCGMSSFSSCSSTESLPAAFMIFRPWPFTTAIPDES